MLKEAYIGFDNNLTYGYNDTLNTSVRCSRCNLLNSFSFDTTRTTCVKCKYKLSSISVNSVNQYKEDLANRLKEQNYNSWNKHDQ